MHMRHMAGQLAYGIEYCVPQVAQMVKSLESVIIEVLFVIGLLLQVAVL